MHRLAVAIGGALGAVARQGVASFAAAGGGAVFPWSTLAVNVGGSWALGLFMWVLPATTVTPAVRAALTIGFCGGFTTFSTFAHETVTLARTGHVLLAAGYVALSLLSGVLAMLAGMATGSLLTTHGRSSASSLRLEANPADLPESQAPPADEAEDGR